MHDERERNLRAHPELLRTNHPYRLFLVILAVPVLLLVAWRWWAPAVSIEETELETLGTKATVLIQVVNRSSSRVGIAIEVSIGHAVAGNDASPHSFRVTAKKRVSAFVDARASERMACEFESNQWKQPNHAEARIVEVSTERR